MRSVGKRWVRLLAGLFGVLVLGAGLAVAIVLFDLFGFRKVGSYLLEVGWSGFIAIVVFHLGIAFLCGVAWFVVVPQLYRPGMRPFLLGRLVRNSSEILPFSHVAGFIMGARAASVAGLSGSMSFASTIVDITMELLAQIVYVALAVVIFAMQRPGNPLTKLVTSGLAAALIVAIAFTAAQRRGFAILETIANRLTLQSAAIAAGGAAAIHNCIELIYAKFSGPFSGFLLHLCCWIASAVEAWFALKLMGTNPGFAAIISIEGLLCAARAAAFAVPSALGVQEGAYVVLGGFYGISPVIALALSVIKRARDLALGIPSLCVWQFMEGGRIWRRYDGNRLRARRAAGRVTGAAPRR